MESWPQALLSHLAHPRVHPRNVSDWRRSLHGWWIPSGPCLRPVSICWWLTETYDLGLSGTDRWEWWRVPSAKHCHYAERTNFVLTYHGERSIWSLDCMGITAKHCSFAQKLSLIRVLVDYFQADGGKTALGSQLGHPIAWWLHAWDCLQTNESWRQQQDPKSQKPARRQAQNCRPRSHKRIYHGNGYQRAWSQHAGLRGRSLDQR